MLRFEPRRAFAATFRNVIATSVSKFIEPLRPDRFAVKHCGATGPCRPLVVGAVGLGHYVDGRRRRTAPEHRAQIDPRHVDQRDIHHPKVYFLLGASAAPPDRWPKIAIARVAMAQSAARLYSRPVVNRPPPPWRPWRVDLLNRDRSWHSPLWAKFSSCRERNATGVPETLAGNKENRKPLSPRGIGLRDPCRIGRPSFRRQVP